MTHLSSEPRRFLGSSTPVRLAWQALGAEWLDDRTMRVDVRAERFEPSVETLTGVPSEIAAGPVGEHSVATLQIDGVCDFAIAGGVIAPGTLCTTSAAGKVVAAASGDRAFLRMLSGKSSTGATADGAECRVLILPTPIDIA